MRKIFVFYILLSLAAFQSAWSQDSLSQEVGDVTQTTELFQSARQITDVTKGEADSAYIQGDYAAAVAMYESLLQQGEATEIYYNLGNSYYKLDDLGHAILNYERALMMQPSNADVQANLEIARAKTVDKVVPVPEIFFLAWIQSLRGCLSADGWGIWAIAFFLLTAVSLTIYFFTKQMVWKKGGFFAGVACLLLCIMCNLFAYQQRDRFIHRTEAIVLSPSVTVRSTPSESGTSLFVLHEGHKLSIKDDSMREWKEIRLADGKVGWVPAETIEKI